MAVVIAHLAKLIQSLPAGDRFVRQQLVQWVKSALDKLPHTGQFTLYEPAAEHAIIAPIKECAPCV